jgi:uncharacterized protein YqcC (DUF446 family)
MILFSILAMRKTIVVNPPKNLSDGDNHIFQPFLSYTIEDLIVKEVRNALITFSGFTVDSTGLVKESHHDYDFQYKSYLAEAIFYCEAARSDPEKVLKLENSDVYLQIFHPWFNYGHWLFEAILRLWTVRDRTREMVLLLPDFYSQTQFIQETLEPFKFKDIVYIPRPKSVLVDNLCLPQIKPVVDSYLKKELIEIREFYLDYVKKKNLKSIPSLEKIYLSRKKSRRRFVLNEEEVEQTLKKYGFVTVCADGLGFFEQVAIYSNARYLISIMGAGLSNTLFMQEGSSILEFHKVLYPGDVHCKTFWYLADALNFNYYYQFCPCPDPKANIYIANLTVDTDLLEKNIALMLNN